MNKQGQLVKIYRVGGREFLICRKFDEQVQMYYLDYPDFSKKPLFTDEGRPFTRSDHHACYACQPKVSKDMAEECDDCVWFYREQPPDVIGICMCDELQRIPQE
jgi:hypothetical protein